MIRHSIPRRGGDAFCSTGAEGLVDCSIITLLKQLAGVCVQLDSCLLCAFENVF